jgi:hypothetical protein
MFDAVVVLSLVRELQGAVKPFVAAIAVAAPLRSCQVLTAGWGWQDAMLPWHMLCW